MIGKTPGKTVPGKTVPGKTVPGKTMPGKASVRAGRRDVTVAAAAGATAALMVGLAYASVPFYSWFCKTTGFGGVPQVAHAAPGQVLDRKVTVRFDANVGAGLPWRFEPERTSLEVRLGEVVTVYYTVTNLSDQAVGAQAGYNVTPTTVGSYFVKINCFCFTDQHLASREKRELAVVFYVDPEMVKDSDQDDLNTITLSYTFFPLRPAPGKGGVAEGASPAGAEQKKI